jgi:hypothetical protein
MVIVYWEEAEKEMGIDDRRSWHVVWRRTFLTVGCPTSSSERILVSQSVVVAVVHLPNPINFHCPSSSRRESLRFKSNIMRVLIGVRIERNLIAITLDYLNREPRLRFRDENDRILGRVIRPRRVCKLGSLSTPHATPGWGGRSHQCHQCCGRCSAALRWR